MTYSEKLKDPRWQKKRLEILERDEWRCTNCCRDEDTLNVHHGYYEKDKEPWEYDNDTLTTLCDACHEERHEDLLEIKKHIAKMNQMEIHTLLEAFNNYKEGLMHLLFDIDIFGCSKALAEREKANTKTDYNLRKR